MDLKIKVSTLTCIFVILFINVEGGGKYKSLQKSSEKFAADLFQNLKNSTENQLISPMSIQTILALLHSGSVGKCSQELANVLYLPKRKKDLKEIFQSYMNKINNSNIDVKMANSMYVSERFKLPKQYEKISKFFNAEIHKISTAETSGETVKQINQWVEDQTNNKIKNIVDDTIITPYTVLVLVNALYFNAQWKFPFEEELTQPRSFYAIGKNMTKTNMMIQMGNFNYTESIVLNAKLLELPYKDEDFTMTIVLPNDRYGLNDLTKNIDKLFAECNFQELEVTIVMPKFTFGDKIDFKEILKKLGLNSIFDQMQFKGIQHNAELKVSQVVQKTFIDVNEKGSEAAAATAVGIEDRMGNYDRKYFNVDHPFLFLIRQKSTGVVLFMGTYKKP